MKNLAIRITTTILMPVIVVICFIMLFSSAIAVTPAFAASTAELWNDSSKNAMDYGTDNRTRKRTMDGNYAFCVWPKAVNPPEGSYTKTAWNTGKKRAGSILWYAYGYDGYSKSLYPDKDWNGNAISANDTYVITHILLSYEYAIDYQSKSRSEAISYALNKTGSKFTQWANEKLFGSNGMYAKLTSSTYTNAVPPYFYNNIWFARTKADTQTIAWGVDVASGTIAINKTVKRTGKALPNAEFTIYASNANGKKGSQVAKATTDSKGKITFSTGYFKTGYYLIVETGVPSGYLKADNKLVEVKENKTVTANLTDTRYVDIPVTKKFVGGAPSSGSVKVSVHKNGESSAYKTATLSNSNNWKYTFENLPYYDTSGNKINWTVTENGKEKGDLVTVGNTVYQIQSISRSDGAYTLTNTPTTPYHVNKIWSPAPDDPIAVTVALFCNGKKVGSNKILNESNNYSYDWSGDGSDGNPIMLKYSASGEANKYTVKELNTVSGYEAAITYSGATATITNTKNTTYHSVEKKWVTGNTATQAVTVYLTYSVGGSAFKDATFVGGYKKTLNASNDWKYTWNNIPSHDSSNRSYTYSTREDVPSGFTGNVVNSTDMLSTTLTNISNEKINIALEKIWDDGNNYMGIRPTSVTVNLMRKNAGDEDSAYASVQTTVLNASNSWKGSFSNLPRFDSNSGQEYEYTISENTAGYRTFYDVVRDESNTNNRTATITNKLEKVKLRVSKVWDDNNNAERVRPSSVTVHLLYNGTDTGKSLTLNNSNNWQGSFDDLDRIDDSGALISYSVEEDHVVSYTTKIQLTSQDTDGYGYTYTITNKVISRYTDIGLEKIWNDRDNEYGTRPDNISAEVVRTEHNGYFAPKWQDDGN